MDIIVVHKEGEREREEEITKSWLCPTLKERGPYYRGRGSGAWH